MTDAARKSHAGSLPSPAGNTATGILKLIALVFMFIDHSGKVLFDNMTEMRTLGRIAFPIYVWCMIVGFSRTRNITRYLMRVLLVGLISQPLYLFALNSEGHIGVLIERTFLPLAGGWSMEGFRAVLYTVFMDKPNIFLTLLLGLIALTAIREKHWLRKVWLPGLCVLALTAIALMHDKKIDPVVKAVTAPFSEESAFPELLEELKISFWPTLARLFNELLETLRIIFWQAPNYFSMIFLYGGALWTCTRKDRRMGQIWGPVIMILLATVLKADYGWKGVLLFILLYAVQDSRPGIAAVMVSFMLFWGSSYYVTDSLFGQKINLALLPDSIAGPVRSLLRSETYSLAGLPLILIRFPKDLRLPKWLSYLLYPGHLILLIGLKVIMFGWFA